MLHFMLKHPIMIGWWLYPTRSQALETIILCGLYSVFSLSLYNSQGVVVGHYNADN